jgi:hypothetical protein
LRAQSSALPFAAELSVQTIADFALWCNGNTAPFGGVILGSNPSGAARLLLFLGRDLVNLFPVLQFAFWKNAAQRGSSRAYLLGLGLGSGNANVADAAGVGDVDPPGDDDDVDVGEGDGVGVGVGGGGIMFSQ